MKKRVGLLFGGMSAEHEVSIRSAKAVYKNTDKEKFEMIPIYISKQGLWSVQDPDAFDSNVFSEESFYSFLPWDSNSKKKIDCDIYFPVLHGPNGEDGKVQALIELSGKPLVGANSLGSALAMDKTIAKKLFKDAGLNIVKYLSFSKTAIIENITIEILDKLKTPVFIKPNSLGSSVGISRAETGSEINKGIKNAFQFDDRIIVEEGLNVREIEVSVMGNEILEISKPGELKPDNVFYDYNDKYENGKTEFNIPAILKESVENEIMFLAERSFKSLGLNGMGRVDFFIEKETEKIFINEINTIPGFTEISMFPKLWETVDISFKDLITRLIAYGFEYHSR